MKVTWNNKTGIKRGVETTVNLYDEDFKVQYEIDGREVLISKINGNRNFADIYDDYFLGKVEQAVLENIISEIEYKEEMKSDESRGN